MPGTLPNHAMSCKLRILTVNSSAEYGVGNERWVPVDRTPTRPLPLELRFGLHATICHHLERFPAKVAPGNSDVGGSTDAVLC
jgi:hypothetical protein